MALVLAYLCFCIELQRNIRPDLGRRGENAYTTSTQRTTQRLAQRSGTQDQFGRIGNDPCGKPRSLIFNIVL